jgi:hypothetical protein
MNKIQETVQKHTAWQGMKDPYQGGGRGERREER